MKWQPLPKIAHGIAVYPFTPASMQQSSSGGFLTPSRPPTAYSTIHSPLMSPNVNDTSSIFTTHSSSSAPENGSPNPADYASLIPLEVGDELFILEQYGNWFRGYVLSSLEEGKKPNIAPIGCFPRTHVQIKEYLDQDPGEGLHRTDSLIDDRPMSPTAPWLSSSPDAPSLSRSLSESHIQGPQHRKLSSYFDQHHHHYPASNRPESVMVEMARQHTTDDEDDEEHRPAPSLLLARFEQSTITGSSEPLVDEIGACVSEWNCLLYKYLEERRYSAFNSVRDHINYLFQARRQLLDQALSKEELARLRKEIIHRMVMLNISQTREMIIRHPERGYILDANSTSLAILLRMHWKYALMEHVPITSFASSVSRPSIASSTKTSTPSSMDSQQQAQQQTQQQQATQQQTSQQPKGAKFHHLFFELKAFVAQICQPGEFTELYFSLFNKLEGGFVTEQFSVTLTYQGMPTDERQIGKLQTLFADLSAHDLNDGLYLVCRVVRLGSMKYSDKEKDHLGSIGSHASILFGNADAQRVTTYIDSANHGSSNSSSSSKKQQSGNLCRRPFGCAVLHLAPLLQKSDQSPAGSGTDLMSPGASTSSTTANNGNNGLYTRIVPAEHDIRIYTATSESTFATLHEDIINNNTKDFVKNPRADMLCVYLRMFYGQLDDVLKTNAAMLQGVPRTSRLGFPDVVFPNDARNELYITLNGGDFVQFARSKNVQVTICARDNITGDVIEHALSAGAGAPYTTYWESMVFYHEQRPRWNETLKVQMKDQKLWERAHLFVTVRHRSSSSNSSYHSPNTSPPGGDGFAGEKVVAMGFLPLFLPPMHRYFVADGTHTLCLYKYDRQLTHPRIYLDHVQWFSRSTAPFNMQNQEVALPRKPQHQHSSSIHSLKGSHRTFSSTSLHQSSSSSNLSEQSSWSDASAMAAAAKLSTVKDTVTMTTLLCSTQFTQNETLVKLLNWRSIVNESGDNAELLSILDKFTFVGEMEVVKFLNDIFDALLDILAYRYKDEKKGERLRDEALAAMVWVLGIVQDRRFSNFRPVLDVYVEQRFSTDERDGSTKRLRVTKHEMVYDYMLKGMLRLCANPSDPKKAKRLRSSMKVWEYLFRFIVRSRGMQQQKEDEGERGLRDIMFKEELQQLLQLISDMMSPDQPSVMIGTQTLALQHFADILGELRRVFSPRQLVDITTGFVNACSHVTGKLVGYRLCMILAIVKGPVFNDHTCRSGLAKSVFKWITVWINSYMAVAKNVIFARNAENGEAQPDHQQMRLPRVQWLEYLRLSLTIVSEILDKVRKLSGMASLGLSTSSISSPSLSTLSRPISMATSGDEEMIEESHTELMTITELAMQLMPQLLNTYKDLQRLTIQAIHASGIAAENTAAAAGLTPPVRTASRHSLSVLRDRSNSISLKHSPSIVKDITANAGGASTGSGESKFSVVLQALATSPTTPFPSTYPFHATSIKNNPAIVATGNLAAMVTTGLFDITIVILELFYLTPRQQWVEYLHTMNEQEGVGHMASFLRQVVHTCMAILFGDSIQKLDESNAKDDSIHHEQDSTTETRKIPDSWLNLSVIAHQVVLNYVLAPAISVFELPEMRPKEEEEAQDGQVEALWRAFFVGLLRVMSSPRLDIEDFLPQTQRVVWKLAGNMKGAVGAKTLLTLWRLAGPKEEVGRAIKSASMLSAMIGNYGSGKLNGFLNSNASVETITEEDRFMSAEEGSSAEDLARRTSTGSKVMYEEEEEEAYQAKILISRLNDEKDKLEDKGQVKEQVPPVSHLQLALIPVILRPLCGVSLTLHDKVRYTAVCILADIITIELRTYETLARVQNLLISTIDLLIMTENKGNEATKNKFIPELEEALDHSLSDQKLPPLLVERGTKAVESIHKFLDLLLQIRSLPLDNDEFVEDRISATLKLMEFIQVIQREDIYIKYVHQLVQLHVSSNNYVEAALTLRFHADLLSWDPNEELPAIPELNFAVQSAFARKEKLYKDMLQYSEKGGAWELCIGLCKELAKEYESTVYDYVKLSEILQRQSQFAQDIVKKERYFAEYFRVAFYGRGFPPSVRHQQFIYRGLEWEKMASFVERMQNQHPNAQLLPGKYATMSTLSEEQIRELDEEVDAQYLQITAVTAESTSNSEMLDNPLVPDSIKKYYMANEVAHFSYSRPFDKGNIQQQPDASKPETDFLNLWTKKTVFTSEETFPTTARRSKVVSVEEVEISPIENAVLAMEKKNEELCALANKYSVYLKQRGSVNISPFSMALNGAVDAPVNGGVTLYKKAFLTDWYWEKNPDMRSWVRRLRTAINDQVEIIEKCLEIHRKLVSSDMKPFHNTLVDFFKKNFKDEIEYVHRHKDTHQAQDNEVHLLDHHHPPSEEPASHNEQPLQQAQAPRPPLARQNSQQSTLSSVSASLPMSPVFSSMRSPTDTRPPSIMMETIVDSAAHPPPASSRAESISRSLKMSLRMKKRPPAA